MSNRVKVKRLDTGEEWESIGAFARAMYVDKKYISKLHTSGKTSFWGYPISFERVKAVPRRICCDDGIVYEDSNDASRNTGLDRQLIINAINSKTRLKGKYYWYEDSERPEAKDYIRSAKPIMIDDKKYPSLSAAAKAIGSTVSVLSYATRNKRPYYKGHKIQLLEGTV